MTTTDVPITETPTTDLPTAGTHTPDTQPWLVVAGREVSVKLRDKNFVISTLVTLGIMVASFAASFAISAKTDHETVAYTGTDGAAIVDAAGSSTGTTGKKIEVSGSEQPDAAAVEEAVRSGDADAGLVLRDGAWTVLGKSSVDDSVDSALRQAVGTVVMDANARAAGTDMQSLSAGTEVRQQLLEEGTNTGVRYLAGFAFGFLFYIAAILFGYSIANSVVEEKQSRIVEILAAAIPLRQLLVGKVAAAVALGLGQLVLFVGVGLVGLGFTDYSAMLPAIGTAALWYLAFFVVGFTALATLFACAGAMSTRAEDVQTTASPLLMVVMFAAFGGMFLEGTGRVIASYVPIMSTVAMPIRLVSGEAAWWEPVLSLLVTVAVAVGVLLVAERVYRRSLMQTGRKLSYREALRLAD